MKKSLIALAVLAASGAAMAQSSVTLYGIADVWVGSVKTGVGAAEQRQTMVESGGVDTSRIGFKGSEDLGGGLKAIFTLEQGFNMDTGAAVSGFNREASVGFAGGFGEVKVGKVWTAYDDLDGATHALWNSNALKPTAYVFASSLYSANPSNGVRYTSPSFSGFTGSVSYNFGEDKTAAKDAASVLALAGKYENGPLFLGAAYQEESDGAKPTENTVEFTRLNASYDFGVVKLLGSYGNVKIDTAAPDFKTNEYQIGADVPLASNVILSVGYASSKDKFAGATVEKRSGLGLGVAYVLSKRTTAYAGLNNTNFKDGAGNKTDKVQAYAVGVKHTF